MALHRILPLSAALLLTGCVLPVLEVVHSGLETKIYDAETGEPLENAFAFSYCCSSALARSNRSGEILLKPKRRLGFVLVPSDPFSDLDLWVCKEGYNPFLIESHYGMGLHTRPTIYQPDSIALTKSLLAPTESCTDREAISLAVTRFEERQRCHPMDQTTQDTHAVTRYSSRTTTVSTLADGTGSDARFHASNGIAIDKAGSLYVADTENHRIRKVSPTGEVSTLAGGEKGESDGTGSDAQFNAPFGISIDKAGNLYVADTENHRIRKVSPMGEVSTLTGSEKGYADGSGSAAKFERPTGIAIDASNNLYVADSGNNRIRKVTPTGEVSTLAGSGAIPWQGGFADGPGNAAQFGWPTGIAIDASNNLYVADANNHRIRKIAPNGEVSTLAGSGATGSKEGGFADGPGSAAQFKQPTDITIDKAGNLYVVDRGNSRIREITPNGEVSTLAGSGLGCADGPGSVAQFYLPSAIAIDASGNLYVADNGKYRIRKIVIE